MQRETRRVVRVVTGICLMVALVAGCSTSRIIGIPHRENTAAVSRDEAIAIANGFFGRPPTAGCFVEEFSDHWFVSPPYVLAKTSKAAGVFVGKHTGEIVKLNGSGAPNP